MLTILIKSSVCLFIFIGFYKLFLEQTSLHTFKRMYLILVVFASIGIPFLTFTQYIEPVAVKDYVALNTIAENVTAKQDNSIRYLQIFFISIYSLGVLLFAGKFCINMHQLLSKIYKNPKFKNKQTITVLLNELITPHTFLSYIFLNKNKYEKNQIPNAVLLHEETHAKQKHSLDILFIEFLQIIFWFHPLLYLLKKDIKLNHEFLADQAVIKQGIQTANYQNILLAYSSNANINPMAHAINYSLIKKRFTVMKTQTKTSVAWLKSLLLLPVLAILMYSFSTIKKVEKSKIAQHESASEFLEISNDQQKATPEELAEYNKLAKYYNTQPEGERIIKLKDISRLKHLYSLMSKKQKAAAEPFPKFPPPPAPPAKSMTKAKKEAHDKMAQKAKKGEVTAVKVLAKQAPLPPPPPPPIPANASKEQKAKYEKIHREYRERYEVKKGRVYEKLPPPPPPIPENASEEEIEKYKKIHSEYNERYMVKNGKVQNRIPPPPPPKSPLDHVIHMAKKGATFYFDGKKISSDEAIKHMKENNKLNISTNTNNGVSTVKLSSKPIKIED
ncbi:MAG: M56 family metallopeptidase [Oceanihabitans sp.]